MFIDFASGRRLAHQAFAALRRPVHLGLIACLLVFGLAVVPLVVVEALKVVASGVRRARVAAGSRRH